jgi:hypothetical protein
MAYWAADNRSDSNTGTLCHRHRPRRYRRIWKRPEPCPKQRTTSPHPAFRVPSAAESRTASPGVAAVCRSPSRHEYASFATSASLPTCFCARRSCARPSPSATSPPQSAPATCRPSTSTNLDDSRAHPRTSATSASGLASLLQPSDPLAVMTDPFEVRLGPMSQPSDTTQGSRCIRWMRRPPPRRPLVAPDLPRAMLSRTPLVTS